MRLIHACVTTTTSMHLSMQLTALTPHFQLRLLVLCSDKCSTHTASLDCSRCCCYRNAKTTTMSRYNICYTCVVLFIMNFDSPQRQFSRTNLYKALSQTISLQKDVNTLQPGKQAVHAHFTNGMERDGDFVSYPIVERPR